MARIRKHYLSFVKFLYGLIQPVWDPIKSARAIRQYPSFWWDLFTYSRMRNSEKISFLNILPILGDKTKTSPFDRHYFYQDIWAARKIMESKTKVHVDVGSRIDFVGFLSAIIKVIFVDIRPLKVQLKNFECLKGDITNLPFADNSISSLSCLHVAEHIGLGRYGDKLDPEGTKKACKELSRVLAKNGNLFFSLPVGKPRLCFNAHRIHSPKQILEYFDSLKLVEFSGIDDDGIFREKIDIDAFNEADYACGLFWFKKL
jgi:SAM-dependent methyltransferase